MGGVAEREEDLFRVDPNLPEMKSRGGWLAGRILIVPAVVLLGSVIRLVYPFLSKVRNSPS